MGNYRELIFYQKARQVVKTVDALIKSWPKTIQAQEISRQLFRSATSSGANIAEGHGRHQGTEYIHFLIISRSSANETEHWLHTAEDCGLDMNNKIDEILKMNNEVIMMISSTINTIRASQGARNVREEAADYLTESGPATDD